MSASDPHLALVIQEASTEAVARCMSSAASGTPVVTGVTVQRALNEVDGELRLLVVGVEHLDEAMEALQAHPRARLAVLTRHIDNSMLSAALRWPRLFGFVAWLPTGVRPWELSYVVRRVLVAEQASPSSEDMLLWGASSVTWHPRTSADRDDVVRAVEVVATRFGIAGRLAATAADAAHELLMNAMYDAPVDSDGHLRYSADRSADVALEPHEVPTLRLTVDSSMLALDIEDGFGRLPRNKVFGGILRGRAGSDASVGASVVDTSSGGAGLGLFNLFSRGAVLRAEVTPGKRTLVSWMIDRTVPAREQRNLARSVYYFDVA